jgi:uncharacterized protein
MSIASPCINVCRMDTATALCVGCYRTLDEIALWGKAGDDVKLAILAAVDKRRAECDPGATALRGNGDR